MSTEQRAAVVRAAMSWVGTPYHHQGAVKGAGVDCATLIVESFVEAGIIKRPVIPYYAPAWHLHKAEERYLKTVALLGGVEVAMENPLPADIVIYRFGRCFSHGVLVIEWPIIVHAYVGQKCCTADVSKSPWLEYVGERGPLIGKVRQRKIFTAWPGA